MLDASKPDVWLDAEFKREFFAGLRNDGFPADLVDWMEMRDRAAPFASLADLISHCEEVVTTLPDNLRSALVEMKDAIQEIAYENATCYERGTPEQTRVTQWPNNPASRNSPGHYFDIFEDHFLRHRHALITKNTPIGSAGSCFALRIAHQLQLWGYNYVIEEDDLPPGYPIDNLTDSTYRMAPAQVGNLFNVPSMRQMVERAFGLWQPEPIVFGGKNQFLDPFRTGASYGDEADYRTKNEAHTAALRRALMSCDVFILTLGLTEAWHFAGNGAYTSVAPHRIDPTLIRRKNLNVAENVAELERLFEIYRTNKPDIKLIVSVSPVPLNKTFSKTQHVVAANCLSKSTLRVAAQEFVDNHPNDVFYFPSFETVTVGTRDPWEEDMRHVSSEAVQRVMGLFQNMFLADGASLQGHAVKDGKYAKRDWFRYLGRLAKQKWF